MIPFRKGGRPDLGPPPKTSPSQTSPGAAFDFQPEPLPPLDAHAAMRQARKRIRTLGYWNAFQQMGRRWPVGCVALEITQRCNLDCSVCYLARGASTMGDLPLQEVLRRIDLISAHYGPGTDVQITGGEPTLRPLAELEAIVHHARTRGLRPTLMTNGIRASRRLLERLATAGLIDVAFHVDTTQQRTGSRSEKELNALRRTYIDRVRGLGLPVYFNTTIQRANFHEIPELVRFFRRQADVVSLAAFQLQADTGRTRSGKRPAAITPGAVAAQIEQGTGCRLAFDRLLIGHPACNRVSICLAVNGNLYDMLDDRQLVARIHPATANLVWDRQQPARTVRRFASWLLRNPKLAVHVLRFSGRKLWRMRADLAAARGRVRKLSFLIHCFMDADALNACRLQACVFKVITAQGPLSMCAHNARRDQFLNALPAA